jgi:hypothetical protein
MCTPAARSPSKNASSVPKRSDAVHHQRHVDAVGRLVRQQLADFGGDAGVFEDVAFEQDAVLSLRHRRLFCRKGDRAIDQQAGIVAAVQVRIAVAGQHAQMVHEQRVRIVCRPRQQRALLASFRHRTLRVMQREPLRHLAGGEFGHRPALRQRGAAGNQQQQAQAGGSNRPACRDPPAKVRGCAHDVLSSVAAR